MKVRVNEDMCEGHAKCQAAAPGVFRLNDDDISQVIVDEVPAADVEAVERAIRLCPRQAIAWVKPA
ncbi:MAG: ferredoxin [Dehalococcoidia bacterium]